MGPLQIVKHESNIDFSLMNNWIHYTTKLVAIKEIIQEAYFSIQTILEENKANLDKWQAATTASRLAFSQDKAF